MKPLNVRMSRARAGIVDGIDAETVDVQAADLQRASTPLRYDAGRRQGAAVEAAREPPNGAAG